MRGRIEHVLGRVVVARVRQEEPLVAGVEPDALIVGDAEPGRHHVRVELRAEQQVADLARVDAVEQRQLLQIARDSAAREGDGPRAEHAVRRQDQLIARAGHHELVHRPGEGRHGEIEHDHVRPVRDVHRDLAVVVSTRDHHPVVGEQRRVSA